MPVSTSIGALDSPAHPITIRLSGQGMQNPAGHRRNIHNARFEEIGIGVINGTNGDVGPQLVTQDFGISGRHALRHRRRLSKTSTATTSTTSAKADRACASTSTARRSMPSARHPADTRCPSQQDGTFDVMFSGGGFQTFMTTASILNGENDKIDYLVSPIAALPGDYNNDGVVNTADYVRVACRQPATKRSRYARNGQRRGLHRVAAHASATPAPAVARVSVRLPPYPNRRRW